MLLGKRMAARTADGSAVLAQSLGFKQYLVTAEANQIRFEEAQDIFSRYLPYAIVFGVADRWARVFDEVAESAAAAGQSLDVPTWYVFSGGGFGGFSGHRQRHGQLLHHRGRHLHLHPRLVGRQRLLRWRLLRRRWRGRRLSAPW